MKITAQPNMLPLAAAAEPLPKAAREFEAAFLTPMVEEMLRSAGPATFGAGNAEEIWRSVLARAIADTMVEGEGIGIAQSVAAQMKAYGA